MINSYTSVFGEVVIALNKKVSQEFIDKNSC